jgi:hypothetical protein
LLLVFSKHFLHKELQDWALSLFLKWLRCWKLIHLQVSNFKSINPVCIHLSEAGGSCCGSDRSLTSHTFNIIFLRLNTPPPSNFRMYGVNLLPAFISGAVIQRIDLAAQKTGINEKKLLSSFQNPLLCYRHLNSC